MDNKTFTETLALKLGKSSQEVQAMTDTFTEALTASILDMDTVAIPSFGNFEPRKRLERISVHPSTGKRLLVPPKMTLAFKPSAMLKKRLNAEEN